MKKTAIAFATATIAAVASTVAPTSAQAQLSLPSLGGSKAPAGGSDINVQQDALVQSYAGANKQVLNANAKMAEALGLKDAAATSRATAEAYGSSSTKDGLSDADKAAAPEIQAVSDELKKQPKLDAASKAKFADGITLLASGVLKYAGMRKAVTDFSAGLKSASVLSVPKLQAGAYVATNFPTGMKTLGGTLQSALSYAKSNDIPVPKDATEALAAL